MKTKILVIVSMLVIVAMSWMPSACAWESEGTETIDEDYYWYQKMEFFNGDYLILSYTITVENDQYIDVMLLNEVNFNKYLNDQSFSYYSEGTDFNTLYKNVPSITFYDHDNYYLVVDNTDDPPGGAQPAWDGVNNYCTFHYTTSWNAHYYSSDSNGNDWLDDDEDVSNLAEIVCILGAIIGIGAFLLLIGILLHYRKKKQRSEPPQQPLQGYSQRQQPYYQDQQPPPPQDYRPPQQP